MANQVDSKVAEPKEVEETNKYATIVIKMKENFAVEVGVQNMVSVTQSEIMLKDAEKLIGKMFYEKAMEKEVTRQALAGGNGFIPGLNKFLGKKH